MNEIKCDESRAKKFFALFKTVEVFGIFLFFVGFNGLGQLRYKYFDVWALDIFQIVKPLTDGYWGVWLLGFLTFIEIITIAVMVSLIATLIVILIKDWIKVNWLWARLACETEASKKRRLEKLGKPKDLTFKQKYGYDIGDKVIVIEDCEHTGKVRKVRKRGWFWVYVDSLSYPFDKIGLKKYQGKKK